MARYYFTTLDKEGPTDSEVPFEFPDDDAAKEEGMRLLSGLASEHLPGPPMDMLSVEVLDAERRPLVELRLMLDIIPK